METSSVSDLFSVSGTSPTAATTDLIGAVDFDGIPSELRSQPNWVLWKSEPRDEGKKPAKAPYRVDGSGHAKVSDPTTWSSFDDAVAGLYKNPGHGLGFVLGPGGTNDLLFIDVDHCREPESGELTPTATALCDALNGYAEVSQSGTGIHVLVRSKVVPMRKKLGYLECYSHSRFVAITGETLPGSLSVIPWRDDEVREHVLPLLDGSVEMSVAGPGVARVSSAALCVPTGAPSRVQPEDRMAVLRAGKWAEAGYASQSEADLSLCNHFVASGYRTSDAVDREFRSSGLYREKWDEVHHPGGETYGEHTIRLALEGATSRSSGADTVSATLLPSEGKPAADFRSRDLLSFLPVSDKLTVRVPTGVAPLDERISSGLGVGKVHVLVGRPGSGKSTLATQIAVNLSVSHPVFALMTDEPASDYVARVAQVLGMTRQEALSLSLSRGDALTSLLGDRLVRAWEPYEQGIDADAILTEMRAYRDDAPVFLLDSVQATAPYLNRGKDSTAIRASVIAVEAMLKSVARECNAIVLATSHSSRQLYTLGNSVDAAQLLSAPSESSSLEFGASLLLYLHPQKFPSMARRVFIVKSRLGPAGGDFFLELEENRAIFNVPSDEREAELAVKSKADAAKTPTEAVMKKIVQYISRNPRVSRAQVKKEVKGNSEVFDASMKALISAGTVVNKGTGTKLALEVSTESSSADVEKSD